MNFITHLQTFAESDDIGVYGLDLDALGDDAGFFEAVLSPTERVEISRLVQEQQRRRVTVSRGALRMIVGAKLEVPATTVALVRDACGRPRVSIGGSGRMDGPHVSCSRSGRYAVVAVAKQYPLGIDIEVVTDDRFPERIAELILSPSECVGHALMPPGDRTQWLARVWVRKEALLKGMGCGLEIDPRSITAAAWLEDVFHATSPRTCHRMSALPPWYLHEFAWGPSVIALATRGADAQLRFMKFDVCEPQRLWSADAVSMGFDDILVAGHV